MKIRVLGIAASGRRKGNSEFLLKQALEGARSVAPEIVETETYLIVGKKIEGCLGCFRCEERNGVCIIEDDFLEFSEKWYWADVILYSIAVYHMGLPGQLKCFLDRLGNVTFSRFKFYTLPKLLKVVGSIAQGMAFAGGQENTITQIVYSALMMGCVPVTGDEPECYIGAAGWTQYDEKRDALQRQMAEGDTAALSAVKGAQRLGRRAVEMALILRSGAETNRDLLWQDSLYQPFLERLESS